MLKKAILFILIVGICFSIQMEIYNIKIVGSDSNKIYPGDTVEVYFLVKNDDPYNYSDVKMFFYPYSPLEKRTTYLNEVKFDYFYVGEEKILRFSFKVPNNVKAGDYKIELTFEGDNGDKIKTYEQIFYIKVFDHNYFDVNLSDIFINQGILNLRLKIKSLDSSKHTVLTVEPLGFEIIGNNEIYLGDFYKNETKEIPLKFYVSDIPTGVYKIKFVINWIGSDDKEYSIEKYLNVFIDNKKENDFNLICNTTIIEKGLNKIFCNLVNLKNYTISYISLPSNVIGEKTITKTKFNITIDAENTGILSFCPIVNYIGKDLNNHQEQICYNIKVVDPIFNINVVPLNKTLYKDKLNKVWFKITSNKNLENLNVYIDGEIVGTNHFENIKKFMVLIKPEIKNYVVFDLKWKYKGIDYEKTFTIRFNVIDKIEKDQLYIFYDNSSKIIGIANRGNSKLYHCILEIMKNGKIIKYKYVGDLDEDDYDSTSIDKLYGKLNVFVQCYDENHNSVNKTKSIYIQFENKKENNNFLFVFVIVVIVILMKEIILFIYKKYKNKK